MLQYDRIDVSQGIDINKTSASKECDNCHYQYFEDVGFKYEPYVCSGCHNISMMACELKNTAILSIKSVDYRCVLWNMNKNDPVNRLNNFRLDDRGTL